MDIISGIEFLQRARELRHSSDYFFELHHLTWNEKRLQTDGIRVVRRCRLRAALPEDSMKPHPDIFLPYTDIVAAKKNQNRMCRKRLVRYTAFPPEFKLVAVDWLTPINNNAQQLNHE